MKEWSKDQEEYTERQFQEIERRKKTTKPPVDIKRKSQVEECLEIFRKLTDLSAYPLEVVEEARDIAQREKKRKIQEEKRKLARKERILKIRKKERDLRTIGQIHKP
jgi:hypothetical protein